VIRLTIIPARWFGRLALIPPAVSLVTMFAVLVAMAIATRTSGALAAHISSDDGDNEVASGTTVTYWLVGVDPAGAFGFLRERDTQDISPIGAGRLPQSGEYSAGWHVRDRVSSYSGTFSTLEGRSPVHLGRLRFGSTGDVQCSDLSGSVTVNKVYCTVPSWFVVVALAVWPIATGLRLRSSRAHVAGRCRRCGYDLRATPDRCPECGAGV
jgi:hypothetical protein